MRKLAAVEEAKSLFNEAKEWGVWRWLTEKKKARSAADAAWAALEEYEKEVKHAWNDDLKKAYRAPGGKAAQEVDPEIRESAKKLKEAEEAADKLHWEAEATFDEADRRLSAGMAREGCHQAIAAWEAREKVIRKAEALGRK
jgi:hypothetical protein